MNKKIIFTILIAIIVCCASGFAVTLTESNNVARFRVEISFEEKLPEILISHFPISRVSVNARTLVAVGNIMLPPGGSGLPLNNAVYMEYELSDDPGNVLIASVTYTKKTDTVYSFVSNPIKVDRGGKGSEININYRIVASGGNYTSGYHPHPSSAAYHTAALMPQIADSYSDGEPLVMESGNQTHGNTYLQFQPGALSSNPLLEIQELYTGIDHLPGTEPVSPIITYRFDPEYVAVPNNNFKPVISLYYGDLPPDINNIEVKWFNYNSAKWQNVSFTNYTSSRTAVVNLAATQTELGYYAIFVKEDLREPGFGPDRRVIRPHEVIKFRGLDEGDVVRIYNSRGKNIRMLDKVESDGTIRWDASYSGGGKVETGSYIYQIKKNGKTTSGTVVVVR